MISKPPGRIYHRRNMPVYWAYMREPRRTFPGDAGDVGDIAGRFPAGVRNGGCSYANGASGRCLSFDGSTGYVQTSPLGITTNSLTITTRFFSAGTQGSYSGIVVARGATANGLQAGNIHGTHLAYNWNDNSLAYDWDSGLVVPTGRWCFAALVIEPTQGTLYLGDGGTLASAVNFVANPAITFTDGFRIGADSFSPSSRTWNGLLDDVRIHERAMSPAEVRRNYADPYWRLRPPPRRAYLAPTPTPTPTASPAALLACL